MRFTTFKTVTARTDGQAISQAVNTAKKGNGFVCVSAVVTGRTGNKRTVQMVHELRVR